MSTIHAWKRFWHPRGKQYSLDHDGYLYDPTSDYRNIYNPNVSTLDTYLNSPCLIMLGKPGSGKSYEIKNYFALLKNKLANSLDTVLFIDLKSCSSRSELREDLFETNEFKKWKNGEFQNLHLVIDSLDECLIRLDSIAMLLIDGLKDQPLDRMYLRIVCRDGCWPTNFEDELSQLCGTNISIIELAPLRKIDVITAATDLKIKANIFLEEVGRKNATSFAINPITLKLLLNKFQIDGTLPSSQKDIYSEGCLLLCTEVNPSRTTKIQYGSSDRLSTAGRIATICLLSQKSEVWTSIDYGNVPGHCLRIEEVLGEELINRRHTTLRDSLIRETLTTGLFFATDANLVGWSHRTYTEFLAAEYILRHNVAKAQIISIITHPDDGKVYPQLYQLAAWLAALDQDIFKELLAENPEVLLQSDITTDTDNNRKILVETYLNSLENGKVPYRFDLTAYYKKLSHPGLENQLRTNVNDCQKSPFVRGEAITIARECNIVGLASDLADLILDNSQPRMLRERAAFAVFRIGEPQSIQKLIPFAVQDFPGDTHDEIKAFCVQALWPNFISTETLFSCLTVPQKKNHFGAYRYFLEYKLPDLIKASDLPAALDWLPNISKNQRDSRRLERLTKGILINSFKSIDIPEVFHAIARILPAILKYDTALFNSSGELSFDTKVSILPSQRRSLLLAALRNNSALIDRYELLQSGLIQSIDIPWLVEQCHKENEILIKRNLVKLINYIADSQDPNQVEFLYNTFKNTEYVISPFSWLFGTIDLDSKQAQELKKTYNQRKAWESKKAPLLTPPPAERISILLEHFENGDLNSWWRLTREMCLEITSTHYDDLYPDLGVSPGWRDADTLTRSRILNAARTYLSKANPPSVDWLGKNIIDFPSFGGYRAIRLLFHEDPSFITTLPVERWQQWTPIILAFPITNENTEVHLTIVNQSYLKAPEEFLKCLCILIHKENKEHGNVFILNHIGHIAGLELSESLLTMATNPSMKPKSFEAILEYFLEAGSQPALTVAQSFIKSTKFRKGNGSFSAIAASLLAKHSPHASWPLLWPYINSHPNFGKLFIHEMSNFDTNTGSFLKALTEDELANLFEWLCKYFPQSEDPNFDDEDMAHFVTRRESVAEFRNNILKHLEQRGTRQACAAIEGLCRNLPHLNWLNHVLLDAREIMRKQTWASPSPVEIIDLLNNPQKRLIHDGKHLVDALVDNLKRFESVLQMETPLAPLLWNQTSKGSFEPKEENILSDFIKVFLEQQLSKDTFIKREVEITRCPGNPMGKRTDIYVDTYHEEYTPDTSSHIKAIIEVKGCWNKRLDTSMETQLLNDYLKKLGTFYGLYVIGWFQCERCSKCKTCQCKSTLLDAQRKYDLQASNLSKNGIYIRAVVLNAGI